MANKKTKMTLLIMGPNDLDDPHEYLGRSFLLQVFLQELEALQYALPAKIRAEWTNVPVNAPPSDASDEWSRILFTMEAEQAFSPDQLKTLCLAIAGELRASGPLSSEISRIYETCDTGTYPSVSYLADIDATPLDVAIVYAADKFNHSFSLFKKIMIAFFEADTAEVACAGGPGADFYSVTWLHPDQARVAFGTYPYGELYSAATYEQLTPENLATLCRRTGRYRPQIATITREELKHQSQVPVLRKSIWNDWEETWI